MLPYKLNINDVKHGLKKMSDAQFNKYAKKAEEFNDTGIWKVLAKFR